MEHWFLYIMIYIIYTPTVILLFQKPIVTVSEENMYNWQLSIYVFLS